MRGIVLCERLLSGVLAPLYRWVAGGARRPAFYDVAETCPDLRRIDENYETIRQELLGVLPQVSEMPLYHEVDPKQLLISNSDEKRWRVYHPMRHRDRCPETCRVISSIPGALNAFFSILEPGKSVPAHEGPGPYYLRYHTAFVVPPNPPTLRVRDSFYTWKERESVLFDDSLEHEVLNESEGIRIVLVVDVDRPLPWPLKPTVRYWRKMRGRAHRAQARKAGAPAGQPERVAP